MNTFNQFINAASSEKITLATVDASKRLMGWSLHSGSIYKLENFDVPVITGVEDSGSAYLEKTSLGAVVAGSFYNDRTAKKLYLRASDSSNPNSRFLVLTQRLFFSTHPVVLPHDLDAGFDVAWEPSIQSTSQFGVEIDTINQVSEAIEGSGTLTLHNDSNFWPANFDKLYFENRHCFIYSFNRNLEATEAQLIYSGRVEKKSYSSSQIKFSLKDILSGLRSPVALGTIADLGLRTGEDLAQARQRLVLGRVFGHVPVNTDQVLDGYPITGTVSISFNSTTLNGSGGNFVTELAADDRIMIDGEEFTVAAVLGTTNVTLTEPYPGTGGYAGVATVIPDQPKRHINRTWHIAGHALREPVTTVGNGSTIIRLIVEDSSDIYAGDWIYIGTVGAGELVQVETVTGQRVVNLQTSLASVPPIGTLVTRPAVQNVRIDDTPLVYYTDYTLNASTATLTLRTTAESNSSPIRHLTTSLTFTNASPIVTGTGFKNSIKPGYMVGVAGNAVFVEVLSIDSDTQLTLRGTWVGSTVTASGRYKSLIYDPSKTVLTLDVLGKTDDGTTGGALLKTAPSIVKALLQDAGLADSIDEDSFEDAEEAAPMHLGLVAPSKFNSDEAPIYRDLINKVNRSVFGSMVQTSDFSLAYHILQPVKATTALRFDESDVLGTPSFESTGENLVKTSIVKYRQSEYDYLVKKSSYRTQQKTSDIVNHIVKSTREKVIDTFLVDLADAERAANRWAFILENGAGRATIKTKLQAIQVEVGSVIEISHRKFFDRVGLDLTSRLFMVESVKKSGTDVQLEIVDLSNAFSRVAGINTLTSTYDTSTEREKLFGGFITDDYGLVSNDPDSFGTNLIW